MVPHNLAWWKVLLSADSSSYLRDLQVKDSSLNALFSQSNLYTQKNNMIKFVYTKEQYDMHTLNIIYMVHNILTFFICNIYFLSLCWYIFLSYSVYTGNQPGPISIAIFNMRVHGMSFSSHIFIILYDACQGACTIFYSHIM